MPEPADPDIMAPRPDLQNGQRQDGRFEKIQTDPLYRLPSKRSSRVAVDSRFVPMLHNDEFSSQATVDRYGRALPKYEDRNLRRLYEAGDSDKVLSSRTSKVRRDQRQKSRDQDRGWDADGLLTPGNSENSNDLSVLKPVPDPARKGGFSESSSSSEDEASDDDQLHDQTRTGLEWQTLEDIPEGEISSRLAVVNLDWDNIRATDLMAVLRSFAPNDEHVRRVTIFPSEFGKERMEKEKVEGPPKEVFTTRQTIRNQRGLSGSSKDGTVSESRDREVETLFPSKDDAEVEAGYEDEAEDEDKDEHEEKFRTTILEHDGAEEFESNQLRQYQLERLRYYYAVVECSSKNCAQRIYRTVDGIEYLSTANFFDLRFIPDDIRFDDDESRDSCDQVPNDYRPNEFTTDALQHSKVRLTWDADDISRKEAQRRAFSSADLNEDDLKAYLDSDTSESEICEAPRLGPSNEITEASENLAQDSEKSTVRQVEKAAKRRNVRALFGLSTASDQKFNGGFQPVGDMQITFTSGLASNARLSVFEKEPNQHETTVEKYVRKEKERKARRKAKSRQAEEDDFLASSPTLLTQESKDDLGFDDPFFSEPSHRQGTSKQARKAEKSQAQIDRKPDPARSEIRRRDLEFPAMDKVVDSMPSIRHFDIAELQKAERLMMRKGRRSKLRPSEKAAMDAKAGDLFRMDVDDSRFQGVFNDPALAVDPSNSKFSNTKGMQKLLEAVREKRAGAFDPEGKHPGKRRRLKVPDTTEKVKKTSAASDDLRRLAKRIKTQPDKFGA